MFARQRRGNTFEYLHAPLKHTIVISYRGYVYLAALYNYLYDILDDGQYTALHYACQYGHSTITEMLIQKFSELKFDLNGKDHKGFTAFYYACNFCHLNTIKVLLHPSAAGEMSACWLVPHELPV